MGDIKNYIKNDDKVENEVKHSYKFLECTYLYIFTEVNQSSLILDYIGIFKAKATEDITTLECGKGYIDEFNYLLKENRKTIIWSPDPRLETFTLEVEPGNTFEPHKHPFIVNSPIKKGEIIDWKFSSRYIIETPTKEAIDNVRQEHFWSSEDPKFFFYDNIHNVEGRYNFYLFAPKWLKEFDISETYDANNLENPPLNKEELERGKIHITRNEIQISPKDILDKVLPAPKFSYDHLNNDYYGVETNIKTDKYTEDMFDIAVLFGFEMPEKSIWEQNNKNL